ncbi:MAG: hypothetical protein Q7K25_03065 [Actinomycetota bacterium]|nr:hypothetical protein [Actinomycetota bacterium]
MRRPGVNFNLVDEALLQVNPITGNRQLISVANDVMFSVELLGGIEKTATFLGVEEIEIHCWIDSHYVPTRYAEQIIERLCRWDLLSLQEPSIGNDWAQPQGSIH